MTVPRCCLSCRAVHCRTTRSSSAFSRCSSSTSGSARGWRCAASTGWRRGSSSSCCPTRSRLRRGRASLCDICQHTSSRSLFAGRWPVSALPPAKRRARLNTCRSRPVSAMCTRCRCYNVFVLVLHSHHKSIGGRLLLLPQAARDGLVLSSVKTRHISWSSLSASPDRWGHGAPAGQREPPGRGTMCLFLCHTPITRPAACGRSRRTSSPSGSSERRGGLEEARLVNLARQSH